MISIAILTVLGLAVIGVVFALRHAPRPLWWSVAGLLPLLALGLFFVAARVDRGATIVRRAESSSPTSLRLGPNDRIQYGWWSGGLAQPVIEIAGSGTLRTAAIGGPEGSVWTVEADYEPSRLDPVLRAMNEADFLELAAADWSREYFEGDDGVSSWLRVEMGGKTAFIKTRTGYGSPEANEKYGRIAHAIREFASSTLLPNGQPAFRSVDGTTPRDSFLPMVMNHFGRR